MGVGFATYFARKLRVSVALVNASLVSAHRFKVICGQGKDR